MNENEVLKIFKKENAYLTGHFLLSSGLHSPNYMQCALVFQKPWVAEKLCKELAKKLKGHKIDAVIGPALGGMIVSYEMGRALKVRSLFAERVDGSFAIRRGFSVKKNERLLVVEDVITTGKSIYEVIDLVQKQGAKVEAVASIVDRSDGAAIFEQDFHSLLKTQIKTYRPEDCPLCREHKAPLMKPGSRNLFVFLLWIASLFGSASCMAADSNSQSNINSQELREDYRVFLQQLKQLNSQYSQITGEIAKVMKEEGVPEWKTGDEAKKIDELFPKEPTILSPEAGTTIKESAQEMVVMTDLPGIRRETLKIAVQDGKKLTILADKKADMGAKKIEKSIELPSIVDAKTAKASYEDGVLTIKLAKITSKEVLIPVK